MKPIDSLSDDELLALVQQAITMPDAPPELIGRALALWDLHRPPPRAQGSPRRWLTALRFDSWAGTPVAAGMRALHDDVRQMLFAAEGCDIDLRIAPAAEGFALSGQLLGLDARGSVELVVHGRGGEPPLQRHVAIDELSEFSIDAVDRGTYQLIVHLDTGEIVLPPIEVGPPRDAGRP
jgi:hypothetical protein